METLGDALPRVMAHVRDKIMPAYRQIGPAGGIALAFMQMDLNNAAKALAEGDVVAMLAAYKSLSDYKL